MLEGIRYGWKVKRDPNWLGMVEKSRGIQSAERRGEQRVARLGFVEIKGCMGQWTWHLSKALKKEEVIDTWIVSAEA